MKISDLKEAWLIHFGNRRENYHLKRFIVNKTFVGRQMEEGIVLKYFLAEKAYTRKENKQIKKDAQEYTAHFFSLYNIA